MLPCQPRINNMDGSPVNADYWAGASDWNTEGKWVWEPNLKPLTYTNWFPGQPNNGRYPGHNIHEPGFEDQNCLLLRYNHSFQWIDTECSGHHFYVCELP
ncbi:hypothetical protein KUTeg_013451 [Tegillarca granosa]|uniref:C-type lectin domain-containing protein n=1 Tax=Tegillarca granosa TaxID=220873 RepID=A0ABQ9EY82_TEGGR|nr:hypothetical protein KUTeg_013451 [Tegillarca granosa]